MSTTEEGDLLYGVASIAGFLGIRPRQAKHRAASGHIPTFKVGDTVCARRSALRRWLAEQEAAAAAARSEGPDHA